MSIFQRECVVDGNVFVGRSSPEVALATRRRFTQQRKDDGEANLTDVVVDKKRERVEAVLARGRGRQGKSGTCIGDVSQNAMRRGTVSPFLPRPTSNSQPILFDFSRGDNPKGYIFSVDEVAFAQGWPWVQTESNKPWAGLVDHPLPGCTISQQQHHVGQGVHLCMVYSWMLYVHAHVCKRSTLMGLCHPWADAALVTPADPRDESQQSEFAFNS